jgi:hypothetical protein
MPFERIAGDMQNALSFTSFVGLERRMRRQRVTCAKAEKNNLITLAPKALFTKKPVNESAHNNARLSSCSV